MDFQQVVQQIVDGMIIVMGGFLILFTLALVIFHFLTNAKQERMQRIKQQVLRLISTNAQIEYLRGKIYHVINSTECVSLQGIRGIRSQRGVQVLEMVSRELSSQQADTLRAAVSSDWYSTYLQKRIGSRSIDAALLATKLIGQLQIPGYTSQIKKNFARWPKDAAVQEIGLLALFRLGEKDQVMGLLSDPRFTILLSFRTLHELFLCYNGDCGAFYQALLPISGDQYIKRACIRGIGESGCKELCDMVLPHLSSPHMNVRLEAIRTLGKLGYTPAAAPIRELTRHEAWEVRCAAVDALTALEPQGCYHAILQCLYDPVWWVRFHAAEALVSLPCREVLVSDVEASGDRYAREMLQYIIQRDLLLAGGAA